MDANSDNLCAETLDRLKLKYRRVVEYSDVELARWSCSEANSNYSIIVTGNEQLSQNRWSEGKHSK